MKKLESNILLVRHISAEYVLDGLLSLCTKKVFLRLTTSANQRNMFFSQKKFIFSHRFFAFANSVFRKKNGYSSNMDE